MELSGKTAFGNRWQLNSHLAKRALIRNFWLLFSCPFLVLTVLLAWSLSSFPDSHSQILLTVFSHFCKDIKTPLLPRKCLHFEING